MVSSGRSAGVLVLSLALVVGGWWWVRGWPDSDAGPGSHERHDTISPPPTEPPAQPDPRLTPRGTRRVPAGRLSDARGEPLARHVVRLHAPDAAGALTQPTLETEATSGEDGRFELEGITVGTKLLKLFGPADGDLPILETGQHAGDEPHVAFKAEEGSLWLSVPADGLDGIELAGPRHASFWVQGQLEF